jgi:hypothetical protein
MPKKINVSLYLDKDLREKLVEMAEEEGRPLSNLIARILGKAVKWNPSSRNRA